MKCPKCERTLSNCDCHGDHTEDFLREKEKHFPSARTACCIADSSGDPPTLRESVMEAIGRYTERNLLRAADRAKGRDYTAALVTSNHAEAAQSLALILDGVLKDHNF